MQMTLKAARANKDLTLEQAADKIGISPYTLLNYEKGNTFPDVKVITKIEKVYDVEYKDIFFSIKSTI